MPRYQQNAKFHQHKGQIRLTNFYGTNLLKAFYFFAPVGKQTIFLLKKIPGRPPPPEYQMVRPLDVTIS